jgi:hypothetical protein
MTWHKIKHRFNILIPVLVFTGFLAACLDPYPLPDVSSGFLVVEGTFTDDSAENIVRLTFAGQVNEGVSPVGGARVIITDDRGNSDQYQETDTGVYQPVSGDFYGVPDRKYVLRIELPDGRIYQSDSALFRQAVPIDDLRYEIKQAPSPDGTEWLNGIEFYIDSRDLTNESRYFLWKYEEIWETMIPNPIRNVYIGNGEFREVWRPRRCFHKDNSRDIMIKSTIDQSDSEINDYPVIFVPSNTARLWRHYRINITQYGLSDNDFIYHEKLQEITGQTGTIFDQQPFTLRGNVKSLDDPAEIVMGYFVVSAVSRRSIDVSRGELPPEYRGIDEHLQFCRAATRIYDITPQTNINWVFNRLIPRMGYRFVGLVYNDSSLAEEPEIIGLELAPPECTTCDGNLSKPLDWDDW